MDELDEMPNLIGDIRIDRVVNEDGTHTLLVQHVEVAKVPADDTAISTAVWNTCRRIELIKHRCERVELPDEHP